MAVQEFVTESCSFMEEHLFGSNDAEVMLLCIVGLVVWALFLVLLIGTCRIFMIFTGKGDSVEPGVMHGPHMYWRLCRAHANACENLPISATLFIVVYVLGLSSPLFTRLAAIVLVARIGQSIFHILGRSLPFVFVRFLFFATQCICHTVAAALVLEHGVAHTQLDEQWGQFIQ